jgi:ParB family chromosome partitioning protein
MTDQSDDIPPLPKEDGMTVPEDSKTITVPIGQVVLDGKRRPINEAKVTELMESIRSVGILNPIVAVRRGRNFRLVAGLHRLEAMKRLGITTIQCTVLEHNDVLRLELAEIDENIIRNNPSAAEHALLTVRRGEIIEELAKQTGTLSQAATSSNQALRRAGVRTGPDIASVRDQASKTGETKDKIQRSKKRGGILRGVLCRVRGTALDKGVELDALAKLPEAEREDLADRAASGEAVSARTTDRKPKPKPDRKVELTRREKAYAEFVAWEEKYVGLEEFAVVGQQLLDIHEALMNPDDLLWPQQQREAGDDA